MASGSAGPPGPVRSQSERQRTMMRAPTRAFTMRPDGFSGEDGVEIVEESELVPPSLAPTVAILRAANEIEEENPRVAYLCRFTAFEKAHTMDPISSGRGVRQFKTYLLHRLEKDEQETKRRLATTDAREIQKFYEHYCKKYLEDDHKKRKPEEMARYYQIASVLYDVLKTVTPGKHHAEYDRYAKGVEKEKASFSQYNILPLNISVPRQPIMEIPEIKAAVELLRQMDGLPMPKIEAPQSSDVKTVPDEMSRPNDLLDWLWQTFGFQKGNVENQKEHLILLLANIDMRQRGNAYQSERHVHVIRNSTVIYLMEKIFENYNSWCRYLHLEPNIRISRGASTQQPELLYIGLYLLIWGEASNVRFMPECLCYIFHHMARDLHDIISDRRQGLFDPPFQREGSDDAFLQLVIQPIYSVMQKAMVIIAWSSSGSPSSIFEADVFRNVSTIFITAAFLNFLQAMLEIILNWKAWKSLECSQRIRCILKFVVAIAWLIILPITYASSIQNPTGLVKFFSSWIGNVQSESIYNFAVALYMLPNILSALFFIFLPIRGVLERSNSRIIRFLLWWTQPKLYVARGMYEDICSLLKYTTFWILLLLCKLAFSFYVEIYPLVEPTKIIMSLERPPYEWHEFFPNLQHNLGVVVTVWAPIVMIPIALDMAKSVKKKDEELVKRIKQDPYTEYAVIECYETLLDILYSIIVEQSDKKVVDRIRESIKDSMERKSLVKEFRLDELPQLSAKFDKLLNLLKDYDENDPVKKNTQIANLLQDIMEIITQDIMKNGQGILKDEGQKQLFANLNLDSLKHHAWREKCVRLQLLLTTKESAIYVPTNLEARRRITFFANSLFMKMPRAPPVCSMMSFSVLTPYFKEEVLFSWDDLNKKNEDGISILFYLRKIYPDEFRNFLERIDFKPKDEEELKERMEEICHWASYRGQTLTRTVRGMMYYRKALEIQCLQDTKDPAKFDQDRSIESYQELQSGSEMAQAIADIKFTYVVSCQVYGMQKTSKDLKDKSCYLNILSLMITNPSLRVAYIDEVEAPTGNGTTEKTYYSVLVKGGEKYDEEIYRIKLPGRPTDIGEGKPENQNHAIIFTRGEALQAIDMNQDNYIEEAFKMRNVLEEFESRRYMKRNPTILGLREHIFTGSVSSLAWFMSNQETSFVTIGQRVLANPLKLYLVMSGLEKSILMDPRNQQNVKALENALASQSIFQLGLLLVLPMVMEVGLEKGFRTALGEFVIMQLQLASVFFTFQLGTKTHYYGRTILHGGAKYRPTGRGFVVYHAKFAENYRMYSRSHFVKGLELLILLVVYLVYGNSYRSSNVYIFVTCSIWLLVASWLFAPFIFNPSCFEWQKTVDDWTDWRKWMGNRGGIGMSVEQSWEAWWVSEQDHLRKTSIRALLLEIIISLRFLIYQYGIVYHLNIAVARHNRSIMVYAVSWVVMLLVLVVLKMVSIGRQKFGTDLQLMFRILKGLLFLGFVSVMAVLFVVLNLTISDVFASILGFLPTGWCILLIGQACSPMLRRTMLWDSIMELGRSYENIMGLILFLPIGFLSWFPFVSEFQTRLLFNQAFSRGLQISRILAGQKGIGEFE
ncbi:unnamed protein product [Urochloa decumbens]|uniref:1,3-beta-glucan synthase n=1 Tax=Urochloa decumbens TaxID=240449 RepID=A0ABC8Z7I9_9POAL